MSRFRRIRFWVQLGISIGTIVLLLALVDLDGAYRTASRFDWHYAPWFAALAAVLIAVFAFRWQLFLSRRVSFVKALYATTIGLGGNMVLPARGGDLVRALYTARENGIGAHLSVSTLFLEKVMDLLFVAAMGVITISLEASKEGTHAARVTASVTALAVVAIAAASLWLARRGALIPMVRQLFRLLRIGPWAYRHAYGPLDQLTRAIRARTVAIPVLLTGVLWCGLYAIAYALIGKMVGIRLEYMECLILVFAGALGLAVPAAPSGLGTFHASIVSGVVLLGRDPGEGLVLAVAIHGAFFLALLIPAAIAYVIGSLWTAEPSPGKAFR
jgi:hypothetical protein